MTQITKTKREIICEHCKAPFVTRHDHGRWPRFCSRACFDASRATTPEQQKKDKHARYMRNRERMLAQCIIYYAENKEKIRAYKQQYQAKNSKRLCAISAAYRAAHPEQFVRYKRAHYEKNQADYVQRSCERKERVRRAKPTWAQKSEINAVYRRAREMTITTGIRHSVDHIIPLQGRLVSGLHVAGNLQVIPLAANIAKHNRFDPNALESRTSMVL